MKPGGNRPMTADRYETEGRGEKGMRYGAERARRQKAGKLQPPQRMSFRDSSCSGAFRCRFFPGWGKGELLQITGQHITPDNPELMKVHTV